MRKLNSTCPTTPIYLLIIIMIYIPKTLLLYMYFKQKQFRKKPCPCMIRLVAQSKQYTILAFGIIN